MQSGVFSPHDSRTLLVDARALQGGLIVKQLNHAGFRTDLAVSWTAAHAALRANYHNSCVVVADLEQSADLEQLGELRRAAPRVWIVVLSDLQPGEALAHARSKGADAVLSPPFSVHDLQSRLAAFALRARPTF